MTNIVEFLEARNAEEEEWALGVAAQREFAASELKLTVRQWLPKGLGKAHNDPWPLPGEPERVLREVAAKRVIIDNYRAWTDGGLRYEENSHDHAQGLREALCALAAIYADHRDYNPEWAL